MPEQFTNNAITSLNGAITSGAASLVVHSAALFPSSGTFRILVDGGLTTAELMTVTAVSGTTFTVTRAAEAPYNIAFAHNDGADVRQIYTAAAIAQLKTDLWENYPISIGFDGGGSVLAVSAKADAYIPFACTIQSVTLLADQSGSVVVDLWKCTYAQFDDSTHPVSGDSICAADLPTISSAVKSQDSTLTGWTTSVPAGTILRANVNSCSSITRLALVLTVQRTS